MGNLLRQARKAVVQGNYRSAERLYGEALSDRGHGLKSLDLMLRYAWCAEQNRHTDTALSAYEEALALYRSQGEDEAADEVIRIKQHLHRTIEKTNGAVALGFGSGNADAELLRCFQEHAKTLEVPAGQTLCKFSDAGQYIWVLVQGRLDIFTPDCEAIDQRSSPSDELVLIGEHSLFTNQRIPHTVLTATKCDLLRIPFELLREGNAQNTVLAEHMDRIRSERWIEPLLSKHPLFSRINQADRLLLAKAFQPVYKKPSETLLKSDECSNGTYLVLSGCTFQMYPNAQGKMLSSALPGDFIHPAGLLPGNLTSTGYDVIVGAEACLLFLSRDFFEMFAKGREWMYQVLELLANSETRPGEELISNDDAWILRRKIEIDRLL